LILGSTAFATTITMSLDMLYSQEKFWPKK
jgi:hypothetical protein